jgi:phenylacetate-CoA ligase
VRDLKGGEILATLAGLLAQGRGLRRRPCWPVGRCLAWQLRRIQGLVRHAYERVPFYRRLYDRAGVGPEDLKTLDDLARFPIVSKAQVIEHYPRDMIARGYRVEDLIVSRSSGSSGTVLDIAYDLPAFVTYVLAGLRLYRMGFAYRPWHRQAYIYTSPYPMRSLLGMYPLRFVSTLEPIDQVLDALGAHPPDLLVCYPSHLRQILAVARERGRPIPRPRLVSVNSEMSTQAERDAMAAELGCPVLDEYSSEELTRIAAQCRHGRYHVFEDINYLETVDASGRPTSGRGVVVGTNLHNRAMPMIRYRQDDLAAIGAEPCPCGWRFRTLEDLQGRQNDSFMLPSGRVLTSGFLLDATYEFLLAHRSAVRDFCLIQDEPAAVRLQVVPGPGWNGVAAEAISTRFTGFLEPGVAFRVEAVQECVKTKSGKRNPIICMVGKPAGTPVPKT